MEAGEIHSMMSEVGKKADGHLRETGFKGRSGAGRVEKQVGRQAKKQTLEGFTCRRTQSGTGSVKVRGLSAAQIG